MSDGRHVPPPRGRLLVKRNGRDITKDVPKPIVLVDNQEQLPYTFERHLNWIHSTLRCRLPTADYSIQGYQTEIALERKSLGDLLGTLVHGRQRFIRECERLLDYKYRAILIEASYEDLKTPYRSQNQRSVAHPNGICGTLDAIETRYQIPIIYTSQHRNLAEEKAASWLSKTAVYLWLERNGFGRALVDGDL